MQSSPQSTEHSQCPICRAEVSRGESFCGACGSKLADTPAEEIRSLNYLLSELSRWEDRGIVEHEQASKLREGYEERREALRVQLKTRREQARQAASTDDAARRTPGEPSPLRPPPPNFSTPSPESRNPRRALLETLSDPHTIRLLLYTGAAMLVVGVVVWLHDILYLKLQEPIVQATLLIIGTIGVTVSGWLTILRTRLRLTGRALTLTGSLLVPVNFWFLVRSGLI
jgi:energy-converting hydrogenase Eha subunit E